MLTIDDIPELYIGDHDVPGARFHNLAAALLTQLSSDRGDAGRDAGHRIVQAAWHLRYAGIGLEMHRQAPSLSGALREHDQFVYLAGFQLAVTSTAASIDVGAAALAYLNDDVQREPDFRQMAKRRHELAEIHRAWIAATDTPRVNALIDVRNALVHRHVPTNVTVRIGGSPSYSIEVDEVDASVQVDPSGVYDLAVDRYVALCVMLLNG